MSTNSGIEWTDHTWNPVSGSGKGSFGNITLHPDRLETPLSWRKSRKVFVVSMGDPFHDQVPDDYIAHIFAVMALTWRHTYQLPTKRHGRMRALLSSNDFRLQVADKAEEMIGSRSWHAWQLDLAGQRLAGDSGKGAPWERIGDRPWVPTWPLPNVWAAVNSSTSSTNWATPTAVRRTAAAAARRLHPMPPDRGKVIVTGARTALNVFGPDGQLLGGAVKAWPVGGRGRGGFWILKVGDRDEQAATIDAARQRLAELAGHLLAGQTPRRR